MSFLISFNHATDIHVFSAHNSVNKLLYSVCNDFNSCNSINSNHSALCLFFNSFTLFLNTSKLFHHCVSKINSNQSNACHTLTSFIGLIFFCDSINHFSNAGKSAFCFLSISNNNSLKLFGLNGFRSPNCCNHLVADSKSKGVLAVGFSILADISSVGLTLLNFAFHAP